MCTHIMYPCIAPTPRHQALSYTLFYGRCVAHAPPPRSRDSLQGCCFVKYSSLISAQSAINALHNQRSLPPLRNPLQVDHCPIPSPPHSPPHTHALTRAPLTYHARRKNAPPSPIRVGCSTSHVCYASFCNRCASRTLRSTPRTAAPQTPRTNYSLAACRAAAATRSCAPSSTLMERSLMSTSSRRRPRRRGSAVAPSFGTHLHPPLPYTQHQHLHPPLPCTQHQHLHTHTHTLAPITTPIQREASTSACPPPSTQLCPHPSLSSHPAVTQLPTRAPWPSRPSMANMP